jgi:hypothetical protein
MLLKNLYLLGSTALAVSALTKRTTITQVSNDVTAIDTHVKALALSTSAYTGGILGALPLASDLLAVYLALLEGVTDSGLLPPTLSEADGIALSSTM